MDFDYYQQMLLGPGDCEPDGHQLFGHQLQTHQHRKFEESPDAKMYNDGLNFNNMQISDEQAVITTAAETNVFFESVGQQQE